MSPENVIWFCAGMIFGMLNLTWIVYVILFRPFIGKRRNAVAAAADDVRH